MRLYELSVAFKYLAPRWRQLSVSIISLISILVISLVVWLIVVFFSVTHGLEKNWVQKLIALTAPVRIVPTDEYYSSYYYQIDSISSSADYTLKTIREKQDSAVSDPYDPSFDEEIPSNWLTPDLDETGELKDLVKLAYAEIAKIGGVTAADYEMTVGNIRLRLLRDVPKDYVNDWHSGAGYQNQSFLNQNVYFGSFDPENEALAKTIIPLESSDLTNLWNTVTVSSDNLQEDNPELISRFDGDAATEKMSRLVSSLNIKSFRTPPQGWSIPLSLLPSDCSLDVCFVKTNGFFSKIIAPLDKAEMAGLAKKLEELGAEISMGKIRISNGETFLSMNGKEEPLPSSYPITLPGDKEIAAETFSAPAFASGQPQQYVGSVSFNLQGNAVHGEALLSSLHIGEAVPTKKVESQSDLVPFWLYGATELDGKTVQRLPSDPELGESILLPRTFRDAGVLVGDRGFLSYYSPTASSVQEQRIPVLVAGFYDPGIIPIGGKLVLANSDVTSFIRSAQGDDGSLVSNGINLRFNDLSRADSIKDSLVKAFDKAGIGKYWKVETYKEYDFTKDIIQQLKSEKNLFSILAIVIIIVACSNIISMLIILVNDKKQEIGILRSMGASSLSIAAIFGLCGVIMGLIGSVAGIFIALITLRNLQAIIGLLSSLQGHDMFNPAFYGEVLPNQVSFDALCFVVLMTAAISLIAGVVPAVKACLLRPSEILRAE